MNEKQGACLKNEAVYKVLASLYFDFFLVTNLKELFSSRTRNVTVLNRL